MRNSLLRRRDWQRPLLGLCCIGIFGFSCMPKESNTPVNAALGKKGTKDLLVSFAAPQKWASASTQISVVMNQPMRALTRADEEAPPFASMTPKIPGKWHWVGTNTVQFYPEGRLPLATSFRVEIPAGTRSLDGMALKEPFVLQFETARPQRLATTTIYEREDKDLEPIVRMTFNQPIAVDDLKRVLTISANPTTGLPDGVGAGVPPIEFHLDYPDPNNPSVIDAHFKEPLPRNSQISVDIPPGLKGKLGPLLSSTGSGYAFSTHGDSVLHTMECEYNDSETMTRCKAGTKGLRLMFTNPVVAKDLQGHLSIEPSIPFTISNLNSRILLVAADWQANQAYTIKVKKELRDQYGESLRDAFERKFEIGARAPHVATGFVGDFFMPTATKPLEIIAQDASYLELAYTPINPNALAKVLGDVHNIDKKGTVKQNITPPTSTLRPFVHRIPTEKWLNPITRQGAFLVEAVTSKSMPLGTSSLLDLLSERPAEALERVVRFTDIVLTTKVSSFGSFMRITRASTGAPIAGAQVSIYRHGEPGQQPRPTTFTSDANGFIHNPVKPRDPQAEGEVNNDAVYIVRAGDDWTFFRNGEDIRFGFDYYSMSEGWPFGLAFSDRQLYRPGETAHIKGILRRETQAGIESHAHIPKGMKLPIFLRDARGNTAYRTTLEITRFGTFSFDYDIPESVALGRMSMFAGSGAPQPSFVNLQDFGFDIAEYRANEITVWSTTAKEAYVRGETPTFELHAESYAGVPMAGKTISAVVTRQRVAFRPPNLPAAFVNEDQAALQLRHVLHEPRTRTELKLGPSGAATFDARMDMQDQLGPERLVCTAEMFEAGGQPVATNASVLIHPASFYLAIDGQHASNGDLLPKVLAVDPAGNRISSVAVRLELMKQGREEKLGVVPFESLGACDLKTRDVPESCALPLQKLQNAGRYFVRASASDEKGRQVAASQWVQAADFAERASHPYSDAFWRLKLKADQIDYRVGDTAKILLESPFERAEALVTVERMGIFRTLVVEVTGPSPTIDIPITGDMWPNADVSVTLTDLSPQKKGVLPTNRRGRLSLPLKREERTLSISLKTPSAEVKPGSSVAVEIDVRDPKGQPAQAEVTLYAVDEGVLSLTGEKRPDPMAMFAKHRKAFVVGFDSRRLFGIALTPEQALDPATRDHEYPWLDGPVGMPSQFESIGSSGTGSSENTRHDFRSTAYFNPSLLTDTQGKAKATFTVPESFSKYRIVAVAVQENDMMGSAETTIRTSHELMLRPIAPRFFRAGDTAYVGAVVSSWLPGRNDIELELKLEGLATTGDGKTRITLERGQSKEVRFEVKTGRVGKGKLRLMARSGKTSDAFVIDREVRLPVAIETVALHGETERQQSEQMGPFPNVRTDVGGLDIELSNSALVGLSDAVAQLEAYPYSCTEQLVSRLAAILTSRTLAQASGASSPPGSDARASKVIAEIGQAQRQHGSFGYWPNSSNADVFVTAYALLGISIAKQNGIAVPPEMIDNAARFLLQQLVTSRNLDEHDDSTDGLGQLPLQKTQKLWWGTGFILDALIEAEIANQNKTQASGLREALDAAILQRKDLEPPSLAMLLHAARRAGSVDAPLLESMKRELEASIRLEAGRAKVVEPISEDHRAQLNSRARTTALVLRALLAVDPAHPMATQLARGLLAERQGLGWGSTQDDAWALLALSDYKRTHENNSSGFSAAVSISGKETGHAFFKPGQAASFHFVSPSSTMTTAQTLDFQVNGQGTVFYSARLKYAPNTLPTMPLDHGAFVERSQRAVNAETIEKALYGPPGANESTLKEGDLVLVDLVVVVPTPRNHLVIEDPLAAGLEPVNKGFKTTAQWVTDALRHDPGGVQRMAAELQMTDESGRPVTPAMGYQEAWHRQEMRDDKVLFFVEHALSGIYRFQYLARAVTPGTFQKPPVKIEDMYAPEIFGRSAGSVVRIVGIK